MPALERVQKPASHRGKREILKKEPQLIETAKQTLCIKGSTSSKLAFDCMKNFYDLKKPDAQMMTKKNEIRPFEDITPIEKFATKLNAPLFMFTSHNKKRPNNLVMGRMFEHNLLDMVEFGIENFKALNEFKVPKIGTGIKPLLIFNGDIFENNHEYGRIRNLLVDMFHREEAKNVRLQGLEHVISFTARDNKILFRSFRIFLKKSGTRVPRIELEEIGPHVDLIVRRTHLASDDLFKQSCKKPKELKVKKKKNISDDNLGKTLGRVHMGAQKLNKIQTRKMKGLRKTMAEKKAEIRKKRLEATGGLKPKEVKTVDA